MRQPALVNVLGRALLSLSLLAMAGPASAGSIFITGHDPLWHAGIGGNTVGGINLSRTGIEYARAGSALPFLFIESNLPVPGGNAYTEPFLISALGYNAGDFVAMDGVQLAALPDFRLALNSYSAIVVASDHGGMLSAAELSFLNSKSADIIDYINAGGGLYAESESNATGMIGATPRFGFLPFLVSSTDFQAAEVANVLTPFGLSLGLVNTDINGNFSHNFFASTGGMNVVDFFNNDTSKPLTLAYTGSIDVGGVNAVPEPSTLLLLGTGISAIAWRLRRRR